MGRRDVRVITVSDTARELIALLLFLAVLGWVATGWPTTAEPIAFPSFIALTVAGCLVAPGRSG